MLEIVSSNQFKKDLRLAKKREPDTESLRAVVTALAAGKELEPKRRDHTLTVDYAGFRECHIEPDWLLVYKIKQDISELYLFRTGTHSDIFS
ncbi:MAG: type II toxin-antitoxin system YafQ family toxin [Oscillibacter sp.]|nr:type II toxin-antitoxin system YafQ family toxin [Oscillibacter sp.]